MTLRRTALVILAITAFFFSSQLVLAAGPQQAGLSDPSQFSYLLMLFTWLLPLGVALVAVGISDPTRAHQAATSLPLALALALGGYTLCGFAFHFGGVGLIATDPSLATLTAEWSPLDLRLGPGWGLMGLRGFMLRADLLNEETLALFISQLALVTTAVFIPLVTLSGRIPRLPSLFLGLMVACVCYPLMGNWLRGGGWLSQLGTTLGLGHGFVDYGLSALFLVGGMAGLAGLVAFGRRGHLEAAPPAAELPIVHLPLNVLAGAMLALIGWLVMVLSQPLLSAPESPGVVILNALLAVAGAALATGLYGWLARGEQDAGLTGRGILAAIVAIGAGLPFVAPWAALGIGAVSGFFLAPAMYLVEHILRLDDRGAVVSVHGLAAIWGMLALGFLADGRRGASWSAAPAALGSASAGQGVSGYAMVTGAGLGQLTAQLLGIGALVVLAGVLPWLILALVARAYTVPGAIRDQARTRAAQLRAEREAYEVLKRRGGGLGLWQRAYQTYFRVMAPPLEPLARRVRRHGPVIASALTPSLRTRRFSSPSPRTSPRPAPLRRRLRIGR